MAFSTNLSFLPQVKSTNGDTFLGGEDFDNERGIKIPFDVTASDNVGVVGMPQCNYSSQSIFPIGTTTVTCKAHDAIGNVGVTSFEVLVKYNEPIVDYTLELTIATVGLVSMLGTIIAYKTGILTSKASIMSNTISYPGSSGSEHSYDLSHEISQNPITEQNHAEENFNQIHAPNIEIMVSWGFEK